MTEPNTRVELDKSSLLLSAAWMSVVLGVAMQLLTMLAVRSPSLSAFAAETVQKVSWSTLVCTGLAIGTTAAKSRTTWTGLAGLIAAPAAFMIARMLQKSIAQALGVVGAGGPPIDLAVLVTAKAIQYGLFGAVIAWVTSHGRASALTCAAVGLLFGGAMAAFVVAYSHLHPGPAGPPTTAVMAARVINELLFPAGCALVLYASDNVGHRLRSA